MARRKIAGIDTNNEISDLPEITGQQLAFVKGILEGKNASDAYRGGYDTSNMKPETIWAAASRLRSDSKVSAWLDASRMAELGHSTVSLEQHIKRLDALKSIAVKTGNVGAAVQAEQLIGKAMGHYVERFEDITRSDPSEVLKNLAAQSPAAARGMLIELAVTNEPLARSMASEIGITLDTETVGSVH